MVVTIEGTNHNVVSVITTQSVKSLDLQEGSPVNVVIKSTSVMLVFREEELARKKHKE